MTAPRQGLSNAIWGDDWPEVRSLWALDPSVAHLNHGSFGATPRVVTEAQDRWRQRAAANPMRYWLIDEPEGVAAARARAAAFLGVEPEGCALVPNVTTAVSTVLASLDLGPGHEVLVTNHGYGAVRLALGRLATGKGIRVAEVALRVDDNAEAMRAGILAAVTEATRLVIVDHVASSTARVFPVEAITGDLHDRGVPVLVDAAHAPGQLPVDVPALGADFWTGNFHKWPCAARGTAALVVDARWRGRVAPLVASWLGGLGFPGAFDLTGTQDQSAWLVLGEALDLLAALGWARLREHGSSLAAYGQSVVAEAIGVPSTQLWGDSETWMRCVPLPPGVADTQDRSRALWRHISDELGCEVAVTHWCGRGFVRLSAHAYNAPAEYERLGVGLRQLLA